MGHFFWKSGLVVVLALLIAGIFFLAKSGGTRLDVGKAEPDPFDKRIDEILKGLVELQIEYRKTDSPDKEQKERFNGHWKKLHEITLKRLEGLGQDAIPALTRRAATCGDRIYSAVDDMNS